MINWKQIRTAHGNALHVPKSINKLFTISEEERKEAYWELDNYIVFQSDLYEAAYYVIEPLVELLEKTYENDRQYALMLLNEIAAGGNGHYLVKISNGNQQHECFLDDACAEKFSTLIPRISKIEVKNEREKKELLLLLSEVNNIS